MLNIISKVFAADPIVGTITNPLPKYGAFNNAAASGGIIGLFTNILRLVFVVAGIYALLNFILAGYQYMNAAGDTKALSAAWSRIWNTLLGLIIVVGSFALAALFGYVLFGDASFILKPGIYGPGI